MRKKSFLLFFAMACVAGKGYTQTRTCTADEARKKVLAQHPELLGMEADYEKQIQAGLKKIDFRKLAKTTDTLTGDRWYDIPIVVHVVHDFNPYTSINSASGDYITDDQIFATVKNWNIVYAKQNADTIDVIAPFKKYVGNPRITLHLATKDPSGNPTKGITRTRSYLTYVGGDQAKFEDWQPSSYINIWFINKMSGAHQSAAAYAYQPPTAAVIPQYDGVIALAQYLDYDKTINHEIGHCLNLAHPWGNTNNPGLECGDDNVDDTPPTKGHNPVGCIYNSTALYDTTCALNYFKIYTDDSGHITLVNYPDTVNAQNIMDYTYCSKMFTIGQTKRMHAALESPVAGRNNLWSPANLALTGALAPMPDLKPIPDFLVTPTTFSAAKYADKNMNFIFPNVNAKFWNESWNDTVTSVQWTFSNGATKPTDTSRNFVINSFTTGGWATITMKVTGNINNHPDTSQSTTRTWNNAVFIADPTAKSPDGYIQEFDPAGDRNMWPSFNYFNNNFKWQTANVGMYDHASMMYAGFDSRLNPSIGMFPYTGSPKGDVDDFFSAPMNLTGVGYLNFYYAGASRTSVNTDITDTLLVDYSTNGTTWQNLAILSKGDLNNNGSMPTAFTPSFVNQWAARSISLPAAAQSAYTVIRFRYKPGEGVDGASSGNNFYLDRIYFSNIPAGVRETAMANIDVAVVPNPTHGNAYVIVNDANNAKAQIVVSDVTGKVVYTTSQVVSGSTARIEIPHSAIAVQGMYLVQTTTGNQTNTQKLVVY